MTQTSVFVVGAGPVAIAFAGALRLGGTDVVGLWARRPAAAQAASATAGVPGHTGEIPEALGEADCIVLAVRDEAIKTVCEQLGSSGLVSESQTILHCSGAISAEEALVGPAQRGLLHPLRAIPDGASAMSDMQGTVFGVQGCVAAKVVARSLATQMGGTILELSAEAMPAYHAAAVMASNYLVTLLDLSTRLLEGAGLDKQQATSGVVALAHSALANITEKGLPEALTGPIRRGDKSTVARHLVAIERDLPEAAEVYRSLGQLTVKLASKLPRSDREILNEIAALLTIPEG